MTTKPFGLIEGNIEPELVKNFSNLDPNLRDTLFDDEYLDGDDLIYDDFMDAFLKNQNGVAKRDITWVRSEWTSEYIVMKVKSYGIVEYKEKCMNVTSECKYKIDMKCGNIVLMNI